jgi:hypothetical protein
MSNTYLNIFAKIKIMTIDKYLNIIAIEKNSVLSNALFIL